MPSATVVDRYEVRVPTDIGTPEELAEHAINEARERARLWCVPALWTAESRGCDFEGNEVFLVKRKRRR